MDLYLKPHESYSVVSDSGCTVSFMDETGSTHQQLTVPAHTQTFFTCVSARTVISDSNAVVTQLPNPDRMVRGLQREEVEEIVNTPRPTEPEALTSDTMLQNGHVYTLTLTEATSLSTLEIGEASTTAEIWVTTGEEVPTLTWPEEWKWVDNSNPSTATIPIADSLNCYVVRRDSKGVVVNLAYYH